MNCENKRGCTCSHVNCANHGKCCACVENHRAKGEFPGCFFSKEAEKQGRGLDLLLKDRSR